MTAYNTDIFISYAHIDNQPLTKDHAGWISRLHESLSTILSWRLGKNVHIWRDDKLQGNDDFADEIISRFDNTAVLVSVITPRYLNSEWCTREVNEFCTRPRQSLFVNQKARVFKVIKSPVECQDNLPDVMKKLLGYDFYTLEDGIPMELDDAYGEKYGQKFIRQVNKLAFEIAELLKTIKGALPDDSVEHATPDTREMPVVYLAECSFDMKSIRDVLDTQLNCLGYRVLPDRSLPGDEESYTSEVTDLIAQSNIAVHLVGEQYGAVPDGPNEDSKAIIQNRLAAQQSRVANLDRLIWLAPNIQTDNQKQQDFIRDLQADPEAQQGADLLIGDIEKLKSALGSLLEKHDKTKELASEEQKVHTSQSDDNSVYLICTAQDRKATVPLRKYLLDHGISVAMPAFKGDAAEVRQINQQSLLNSRHVIVFYGEGEETWKRSIDTEIRKLPAYLDGRDPPIVHTYLAAPITCDKEDMIDIHEANTIDGTDSLALESLNEIFSASGSVGLSQ